MPAELSDSRRPPSALENPAQDLRAQLVAGDLDHVLMQTRHETVPLKVSFSRRRSIGIHIYPDRPAELRLPHQYDVADVIGFLGDRMDWIERTVQALPHGAVHPQRYHDGAYIDVLGTPRTITLAWGPGSVSLRRDQLLVFGRDQAPLAVERQLNRYLSRLASEYLPSRLASRHQIVSERLPGGLPAYTVSVRKMKAAWGRCRESGRITLNTLLVQKSPEVIDLVLIHELCHLLVMDHGPRFHALLDIALPDWRRREVLLSGRF